MPYRDLEPPASRGRCPRCRGETELRARKVGSTGVDRCDTCRGVWIGAHDFNELVVDMGRQDEVIATEPSVAVVSGAPSYVACPTCGELMARKNFGRTSGILVDSCRKHGIWLDHGELRHIVEFLRDQPLVAAAPREPPPPKPLPPEAAEFLLMNRPGDPPGWGRRLAELLAEVLFWL